MLLHDRRPEERLRQFLSTLVSYIQAARRAGFVLAQLRPEDIVASV